MRKGTLGIVGMTLLVALAAAPLYAAPPTKIGQIVTTASGLKYSTMVAGTGAEVRKGDTVTVHYVGTLANGQQFASSRESGQPFNVPIGIGRVIPGWDEGIVGMKVGEKRKLVVPPELAYGSSGAGGVIPPNATLTFEIDLLDVSPVAFSPPTPIGQETTTKSGLKYVTTKAGAGATANAGDLVAVHYVGTLLDGTKFDSSRDRGQPIEFPLGFGDVIKGWDEGIAGMQVGEQRTLTIPPNLGYGARGAGKLIPPNATLTFKVELMNVKSN